MPNSFAHTNTSNAAGHVFPRISPLKHVAAQGRFGASILGVTLVIRHPVSIVNIIVRKGQAEALSSVLQAHYGVALPAAGRSITGGGLALHWCGADRYYAQTESAGESCLYRELKSHLATVASCSDQSHGLVIISIEGPSVRGLLAKGTSIDLHPRVFGPGQCAVTQMAHVGVHLAQTGSDTFEISLPRSFSQGFWAWLTEQAEELGYAVR